jgi:hypothetical protein
MIAHLLHMPHLHIHEQLVIAAIVIVISALALRSTR